jgi:hypothetical protein
MYNHADREGGAIKYTWKRPIVNTQALILLKNTARYGANIASFPVKMQAYMIANRLTTTQRTVSRSFEQQFFDELNFVFQPSERSFYDLALYLIDEDEQVYTTDSSSYCNLP